MLNKSSLSKFAYVSEEYTKKPIQLIIVNFPGLGSNEMKTSLDSMELRWAQQGCLMIYPFINPWSWMNEQTVKFTNLILSLVIEIYKLNNVPILARGCSMGGYCALAYARFGELQISAAMAVSPVCDLVYHYSERLDTPRTLHDAMGSYQDITELLRKRSPVQIVSEMPDIPYLIVHGVSDREVSKTEHSDKLVSALRIHNRHVEYVEDPHMHHCSPFDFSTLKSMDSFVEEMKRNI